jgi:hypothetical protein
MAPDAAAAAGAAPAEAPPASSGKAARDAAGGASAPSALAAARAALAQLRPGDVHYDFAVPPQLLHPASALQLYSALLGATRVGAAPASRPPRATAAAPCRRGIRTSARRCCASHCGVQRAQGSAQLAPFHVT